MHIWVICGHGRLVPNFIDTSFKPELQVQSCSENQLMEWGIITESIDLKRT